MSNKIIAKELLIAVQNTVKTIRGNILNDELIESITTSVQPIVEFYNLSVFQAMIYSVYLENSYRNRTVTMDRVLEIFGKDMGAMADVNEALEELEEKKLLIPDTDAKSWEIKSTSFEFKTFKANSRMVLAMVKGDRSLIEPNKIESFIDFLDEVADLIRLRIDSAINTDTLLSEVDALLKANQHFNELKWILSYTNLTLTDIVLLLDICHTHLYGEEAIDFDIILKEVFQNISTRAKYRVSIKEGNCNLLKYGIIEFSENSVVFANYIKLTDESINALLGENTDYILKNVFKPKTGVVILPESIAKEHLFYNNEEKEQLDVLTSALCIKNYSNLVEKMKANNMLPSFTCLFYGFAGTGKTASVKQIAASTGRAVFMVEMDKIKSKWVGDSEKNLSKIFSEYKELKKTNAQTPILLFNEADAILGKRINVGSSVDQMNNTLQNILLQELEDFDGILIATTNLASQLDPAFDRRLLYKIEFKKPCLSVRENILSAVFNNIGIDVLKKISNQFELTGGQIANIKKKLLVKTLLQSEINTEEALVELCKNEFVLSNPTRNYIGFKHI